MIWLNVKPRFPPMDRHYTKSTDILPQCDWTTCCLCRVGSRPDGSHEPDFEAQVRLTFADLKAALSAGGCTFHDIVDVTSFHTDPETQMGVVMSHVGKVKAIIG